MMCIIIPDNKVHEAYIGSCRPQVGPMNLAIKDPQLTNVESYNYFSLYLSAYILY